MPKPNVIELMRGLELRNTTYTGSSSTFNSLYAYYHFSKLEKNMWAYG